MNMQRGSFLPPARAEEILNKALKLLAEIGIALPEDSLQKKASKAGLSVVNGRVALSKDAVVRYLETLRTEEYPQPSCRLSGKIGIYASRLDSGERKADYCFLWQM